MNVTEYLKSAYQTSEAAATYEQMLDALMKAECIWSADFNRVVSACVDLNSRHKLWNISSEGSEMDKALVELVLKSLKEGYLSICLVENVQTLDRLSVGRMYFLFEGVLIQVPRKDVVQVRNYRGRYLDVIQEYLQVLILQGHSVARHIYRIMDDAEGSV